MNIHELLPFGPRGTTPDDGMLRSGLYNNSVFKDFNSSNQYVY